ncbi:Transmembrane protein 5 [Phytophthora pseudosyringae]|uniref:Transmembrane protein 5 n=1 Tax=Phytophthora pseudosyringae TaxID=221518 RepID=A0A8T1WM98_9STRA|nr:Transmembrane protein 5 [Phytophthora pseudosyringae]
MANALHMYPSVALLLWVWGTGVMLQVVVLLGWWAYRHERAARAKRGRHYSPLEQDDATDCASTARGRRTSDDVPELSARRHSSATVASVKGDKETASANPKPARTGAEDDDHESDVHVFNWKRLVRRSAIATLLIALASVITTTIVLKLRTGSYVEQPYEWYSLENTGKRLFQDTHKLPVDIMDTCKFRDAMADYTKFQTLHPVVQRYAEWKQQRGEIRPQPTVVHVVPFDYNHVLELNPDQVAPIVEPLPTSWTASSSSGNGDRDAAAVVTSGFVKARPVDEITLFPYLWHGLLGPYFDPRVKTPVGEPWTRTVDGLNLEFRMIHNAQELRSLPGKSNLLVAAQSLDCVNRFFEDEALPPEPRVGFFTLSNENCNNRNPESFLDNAAIKFGLMPYGDCALVDGKRFASLPLGASFEHGFPLNAHHLNPPPPLATGIGRKFLLNLMVSWTIEKPTRVQAMMAALQVCGDLEHATRANSRRCVVEHNDMLFKVLQAVDKRLGTAWRWYLSTAPAAYVSTLQQSIFTICPLGKNPEQYRIWEALSSGSIPIVEELPAQCQPPGVFYHPAYPDSWRCVPEDVHGVLRRLNAPVLFVSDWKRDLPRLLNQYFNKSNKNRDTMSTNFKQDAHDNTEWGEWTPTKELLALQSRTRSWYVGLGHHLQSDLIDKVMTHFAETS